MQKEDIRHEVCQVDEMKIEGFSQNPPNRCYLCKHALFEKIGAIAEKMKLLMLQKVLIWMILATTDRGFRLWRN